MSQMIEWMLTRTGEMGLSYGYDRVERYSRYTAISGVLSFGALCFGSRSSNTVFLAKIVAAVATALGLLGMLFMRIWKSEMAAPGLAARADGGRRLPQPSRVMDAAPPPVRMPARLTEQTIILENHSTIIVRPMLEGCNPTESRFFDVAKYKNEPNFQDQLNLHLDSPSGLFNQQAGLNQPTRFLFVRLESASDVDEVVNRVKDYLARPGSVTKTVTMMVQLLKG